MAGLVKASLSKRSPKALSVIYLPSFPASGESFTEARTAKIGGSIGWHSTGGTLDLAVRKWSDPRVARLKKGHWFCETKMFEVQIYVSLQNSTQYTICVHILDSHFSVSFAARRLPTLNTMWIPEASQIPFYQANHQDTFECETKVCVHLGMKPVTLMETMSPALALFTASRVTPRTTVISLGFWGSWNLSIFPSATPPQSTQKDGKGKTKRKKEKRVFASLRSWNGTKKTTKIRAKVLWLFQSPPPHHQGSYLAQYRSGWRPSFQDVLKAKEKQEKQWQSPKSGSVNDTGGGTFLIKALL